MQAIWNPNVGPSAFGSNWYKVYKRGGRDLLMNNNDYDNTQNGSDTFVVSSSVEGSSVGSTRTVSLNFLSLSD